MATEETTPNSQDATPMASGGPSDGGQGVMPSLSTEQLAAILSTPEAEAVIRKAARNEIHSYRDSRFERLQKVVDDLASERGLNANQKETLMGEMVAAVEKQTIPPASGTTASVTLDIVTALKNTDYEIATLDAGTRKFVSEFKGDQTALQNALLLRERVVPAKPTASPGAASMPGGTSPSSESNPEQLAAAYSNEMIAARGKPTELKAIKAKYAAQGVPVDQIGFNV